MSAARRMPSEAMYEREVISMGSIIPSGDGRGAVWSANSGNIIGRMAFFFATNPSGSTAKAHPEIYVQIPVPR